MSRDVTDSARGLNASDGDFVQQRFMSLASAARHQHVSVQKMMTVVIRGFTTGLLQLCHKTH